MKSTVAAPVPARRRSSWFVLTLLLPALVTEMAQTSVPHAEASIVFSVRHVGSADLPPYLTLIGAPGLRFAEVIPPVAAAVPPRTGGSERARADASADVVIKPALGAIATVPVNSALTAPKRDVILPEKPPAAATEESHPAEILPDDAAPKVKPEDFLPFFEFPGGGKSMDRQGSGSPGSLPPAPPLPRSTATYKEE